MAKIDMTPCPQCKATGPTLRVEFRLVAKPVGTYSVAGAQDKVVAQTRPVLLCGACDLNIVGEVVDGTHVEFPIKKEVSDG